MSPTAPTSTAAGLDDPPAARTGETQVHADATSITPVTAEPSEAGAVKHVAGEGDSVNGIADQYGFFWETLWNHADNGRLKTARRDPNVLLPGDEVIVPAKQTKEEAGGTEQRHRFRRRGTPARLVMQLFREGEPRANEPYTIVIDGEWGQGTTDGEGTIDVPIPPAACRAELLLGPRGRQTKYQIALGGLDPSDSVTGVQGRLRNLGYDVGEIDGEVGAKTRAALCAFQAEHGLPETGEVDEETCRKLKDEHGS
jgi:hypothetical protein